jgi:PTH1 family peptidyl-tRNA hydrolase
MKFLIFGLGNIGEEYASTRHNVGFRVVEKMAADAGVSFMSRRYCDVAEVKYKGKSFLLLKPATFMNRSGLAVRFWMTKEKLPVSNILVIVDDIALPLGTLRMKIKGGDGGHNGLISITEQIGSNEFPRLRFGIGDNFPRGYQVDYVLGNWTPEEDMIVQSKLDVAVEMIKSFGTAGIEMTMTAYNNK